MVIGFEMGGEWKGNVMGGWSQRNDMEEGKSCAGVAVVWGFVILIALVLDAMEFNPVISVLSGIGGAIVGYAAIKLISGLRNYLSKEL